MLSDFCPEDRQNRDDNVFDPIPVGKDEPALFAAFLTGHEDPSKPDATVRWEDYAALKATLCVYMGVKNLATITARLEAGGLASATPAAIVESATNAGHRQILGTLGTIAGLAASENVEAPAMIIIGEVAAFSEKLAWFESSRHLTASR